MPSIPDKSHRAVMRQSGGGEGAMPVEETYKFLQGDAVKVLATLPAKSVQLVCTSPP